MIQLSLFSFLALLEAIAALLVILGFMIWRLRRSVRQTTRIQFIDATEQQVAPSLYLDSEAAKTQTFVEALRERPRAEPGDPALRAALGLRAGLLRQESALAVKPVEQRDIPAWTALAQQVAAVLEAEGLGIHERKAHEIYGEDTATSETIVTQQAQTIRHLRDYIQQLLDKLGHQPSPDTDILKRFDELERANRELNQCVLVLEDENSFLRDQIAALLKLNSSADET